MQDNHQLQQLLAEVKRTKAVHRFELGGRGTSTRVVSSRHDAFQALEAYVAALNERGLPVPPTLHVDLDLMRGLCGFVRRRDLI